jgi:hypothetical protein
MAGNDTAPTPNDQVERAFTEFLTPLNRSTPHQLDDNRFYRFIVVAHQSSSPWNDIDVEKRLAASHVPREIAKRFAERYRTGRALLLKKERMESGDEELVD